jgi:arabinogalactan oligomer/maltooligosaccharide transport system permease protein
LNVQVPRAGKGGRTHHNPRRRTVCRGSKEDAIQAIEGASITKVEGSTDYRLAVATKGDPITGDIVFLLTDFETKQSQVGTSDGLEPLPPEGVRLSPLGNVTEAPGYTILTIGAAGAREEDLADSAWPPRTGRSSPPA